MKRVGMGLLLLMGFGSSQAQFLGGIFSQGSTELKNDAAQIAALQALGVANRQDYDTLENRLEDLGEIHGAEYTLHVEYFAGLAAINPQIASLPEVREISSMAPALGTTLSAAISGWTSGGGLSPSDLDAVAALDSTLSGIGREELGELQILLTPGALTMGDAQRIQAIRRIAGAMYAQYEFMQQVCVEGDLLMANRKKS